MFYSKFWRIQKFVCFDRSRSLRSLRKGTKNLIFLENHKAELESESEEDSS